MLHHNFHESKLCRAPAFDIPTAIDVFTSKNYLRLPSSIRNVCQSFNQSSLPDKDSVYARLHDLIQFRLFSNGFPKVYTNLKIENGRAYCQVKNCYELNIYQGHLPNDNIHVTNNYTIM